MSGAMSGSITPRLALDIEDARWNAALPNAAELISKAVSVALADIATNGRTVEVGIRLVDDGTIQALNRDWRGRDKPTNVLSFPLGDAGPVTDPDFPWLIGDIVMSYDTVMAEAIRDSKPLEHHVVHLAIHATLHLIGHDHEDEDEAQAMEAAEVLLLEGLGIPDPYAALISPYEGAP
jgi:probable rRNA maturation factor